MCKTYILGYCYGNKKELLSSEYDWIFLNIRVERLEREKNETVKDESYKGKFVLPIKVIFPFGLYRQSVILCQIYYLKRIWMASMCHNFNLFKKFTQLKIYINIC